MSTLKTKILGWFGSDASRPLSWRQKVVSVIVIVIFLFIFYLVLDANKYRAVVKVIEGESLVGVNPTTEALDFGDLSKGVSAVRRVEIINGTAMPMYVMVFKTGSIADLIDINKNYFKLEAREQTKIEFTMFMPASAEINKIYRGRVYLFKIPTFWL